MKNESLTIDINENFPIEKALKKFKRLCDNLGIRKEYRKRKEYLKPSIRTKEKLENAEKRRRKTNKRISSKF